MKLTQIVFTGTVAIGLMCAGRFAQASDSGQDVTATPPMLVTQGSADKGSTSNGMSSGGFKSGLYSGTPDLNSPGSTRDTGKPSAGTRIPGRVARLMGLKADRVEHQDLS